MSIQTKTMTVKSDTSLAETTTTIRDTVTFDVSSMPNGITYKGLKAVLSFAEPIQWNRASTYDALTVVWDDASHGSYASKRRVPQNIELTNEFYWLRTADLDAQVEMYRQEVKEFDGRITANTQAIAAETARAESAERANSDAIAAETARAESAESANSDAIASAVKTQSDFSNTYGGGFKPYGNAHLGNIPGNTYPNGFDYKDGYYYVGFNNNGVGTINKYTLNDNREFVFEDACTIGDTELTHCNSITHYGNYLYVCGGGSSDNNRKIAVIDTTAFKYVNCVQLPLACDMVSAVAFNAPWAQNVPTLVGLTASGHHLRYLTLTNDGLNVDPTQPVFERETGFSQSYSQGMAYYYGRIFIIYSWNNSTGIPYPASSYIAVYDINADSNSPIVIPIDLGSIKPKTELEDLAIVNNDLVITDVTRNVYIIEGGAHIGEQTDVDFNYNHSLKCLFGGVPVSTKKSNGSFETITLNRFSKECKNRNIYVEIEFKFNVVGHHSTVIKMPLYSDCVYGRTFDIAAGLITTTFLVNYQSSTGSVTINTVTKDQAGKEIADAKYNCSDLHVNIPGYRYSMEYTL